MHAGEVSRVELTKFPSRPERITAESRYWKKYKFPILTKQYGAITNIDFSSSSPHDFLVTNSSRVALFDSKTSQIRRSLTRFSTTAYSGTFRSDGKLIACGAEDGIVRVFNAQSKSMLRSFSGNKSSCRVVGFSKQNQSQLVSGSDDLCVRLWDVEHYPRTATSSSTANDALATFEEHTDYVRALAPHQSSSNVWASGSYDHSVKLWDTRSNNTSSIMSLNHGHPVQALLISGSTLVSAGAEHVRIWDILSGKLMRTLSNHQKAVTSLCTDQSGQRLLSASLDHLIKVYDLQTFKVVHTMKYPAPILSIGLAPDDSKLVVGMSDSMLSIRNRSTRSQQEKEEISHRRKMVRPGTRRFFIRGQHGPAPQDERVVDAVHKKKLQPYERELRKFRYRAALDRALDSHHHLIIVSVLRELMRRNGVIIALSGRDDATLLPILKFLYRHVNNPRYSDILLSVFGAVLSLYAQQIGKSPIVDEWFRKIQNKLHREIKFQKEMLKLLGSIDVIVSSSTLSSNSK